MSRAKHEHEDLVKGLTLTQARDALLVLLDLGEPVTRWGLEAIAIACPGVTAAKARSLKPNPLVTR